MSLFLHVVVWGIKICQEWITWFCYKAVSIQRFRASYNFLVSEDSTTLSSEEIIVVVDLVKVWAFNQFDMSACVDGVRSFWLQFHGFNIKFSQCDTVKWMMIFAVIPSLLNQIFVTVFIMEEGCVKTDTVKFNWVCPWPFDVCGSCQIVGHVFESTFCDFHVGINQPKFTVSIRQIWRPNSS